MIPTPDKNIGHFDPKPMISVIPAQAGIQEIRGTNRMLARAKMTNTVSSRCLCGNGMKYESRRTTIRHSYRFSWRSLFPVIVFFQAVIRSDSCAST
jgi:hypothetical protein